MRITVVGAILIVAGLIVAVLILDSLLERENRNRQAESLPGGPATVTGIPGV